MLSIQMTEQLTGVSVSGDYWDFVSLIDAISEVIGDEKRYNDFKGSRSRILRVLIDFRRAKSAEKNIEFVPNGLNMGLKHERNVVAPEKNVYYSVEILLPEIIFTAIALNDFILLHQETIDDSEWNIEVATVRYFQSLIADLLEEYMDGEQYMLFLLMLHSKRPAYFRYATQFVDILNIEYLKLDSEERKELIPEFTIRLLTEDEDYKTLEKELLAMSNVHKKELHEYKLALKYPDEIYW